VETFFGEAASSGGHLVFHWTTPTSQASRRATELDNGGSVCPLSSELLEHPSVTAALDRCAQIRAGADTFATLCKQNPQYEERKQALQKAFFEVARASALYIVAHRVSKPDDAGLPVLDLGGNIGWAAQMYANRFAPGCNEDHLSCQLFLFDNAEEGNPDHLNDTETRCRWNYWQLPNGRNGIREGKWIPFGTDVPALQRSTTTAWKAHRGPPAPSGFYAGLGTTSLPWSCTLHAEALQEAYAGLRCPRPSRKGKGKGSQSDGAERRDNAETYDVPDF
jgi:hypothetical protein